MLRIYYILHWIVIVSAVFNDTSCDPDGEDSKVYVNGLNIQLTKTTHHQSTPHQSSLFTSFFIKPYYIYGYHVGEEIINISLHSSTPYITSKCYGYGYGGRRKIKLKYERPNIIANPPLLMTEKSDKTVIYCTFLNETEAVVSTFKLDAFYPKLNTSNVAVLKEYMTSINNMSILVEYSPNEEDTMTIRVYDKTMVYCHPKSSLGSLRMNFSRDNIKDLYITEVSGPNLNNRTIRCLSGDNELLIHLIKSNQSYDGNDNGRTTKDGVEPLNYTTVSELEPETIPTSPFLGYIVTVVVVSLVVGGAATYFYYRRRNQKINANMANNDVNQSAPASADPDYPTFCGNPAYDVNLYSAINVDPEDCYHFYHEIPSGHR